MTAGLKVASPGLHTTVQDRGRFGYQALGVPVSGALDPVSLRLANALAGNNGDSAALEILVTGPRLEVVADAARVALAGGVGAGLALGGGGPVLPAWQSMTLFRGDIFEVILGRGSVCGYLAVEGGIGVPKVLGSASTYVRAGLGGYDGRALQTGDFVPLAIAAATEGTEHRLPCPPPTAGDQPIRIVLGPQHDRFSDEALSTLLEGEFRISTYADRMGMRLDGPRLRHRAGWDIVSDAIATGAIQVPGSGQPILLLADHQTTGGYPKIATVVSADLPVIGRRRPGDAIRFTAVTLEAAEALAQEAARDLAALLASIEPAPAARSGIDLASLYDRNLISGVIAAGEQA
jgi:biotin-dependent carboxylase-like uncharacterized protein